MNYKWFDSILQYVTVSIMNILSLFDGMGCGAIALKRAGIHVSKYYSSEIDKYASGVSKFLHPDSVQLGDVKQWRSWGLHQISLLIGGSPCQGFSFAGKQKGMSTDCKMEITTLEQYQTLRDHGFQFDGQSYLFWEYVEILTELKPKYFLLENVVMAKKWQDVISQVLGVEPIMINSALVSAQNRKRLYWCNWYVDQPEDRGLLLKDIIQHEPPTSKQNWDAIAIVKNRGVLQKRSDKSMCIDANYYKGVDNHGQRTQIVIKGHQVENICYRKLTPVECERLQTVPDNWTLCGVINGKMSAISNSQRYKMLGNGWNVETIVSILKGLPNDR